MNKRNRFFIDNVTPPLDYSHDEPVSDLFPHIVYLSEDDITKINEANFNPNKTSDRKYNKELLIEFLGGKGRNIDDELNDKEQTEEKTVEKVDWKTIKEGVNDGSIIYGEKGKINEELESFARRCIGLSILDKEEGLPFVQVHRHKLVDFMFSNEEVVVMDSARRITLTTGYLTGITQKHFFIDGEVFETEDETNLEVLLRKDFLLSAVEYPTLMQICIDLAQDCSGASHLYSQLSFVINEEIVATDEEYKEHCERVPKYAEHDKKYLEGRLRNTFIDLINNDNNLLAEFLLSSV